MIIDSLVAKLSFDFDDKDLKKFDEGMKNAGKAIAAVSAAAVAAGTAIFAFTSKIADQNDEIGKLAQTIGISAKSLNELGFVAQFNGSSIESMNGSLERLSRRIAETARDTGEGVEIFKALGIGVKDAKGKIKGTDTIFLEIAESISKLESQAKKIEFLDKLGIDASMLLTMEQGAQAILNQRKEVEELGFTLDKNATKAAADFNDEMLRVKIIAGGVASAIGTKLMKQIQPMVKVFVEWFKVNKEIIHQKLGDFFEKLTRIVTAFFNIGARIIGVINTIVQSLGGWETALQIVGAAWLILYGKMLLLPAIILAISAVLFLLIEDFVAFASGADSQLGALAEKFPIVGKAAMALVDIFKLVRDGWSLIFTDGEKAFEGLMIIIKDIGNAIVDFILSPINKLKSLISGGFQGGLELAAEFLGLPGAVAQPALATTGGGQNINNNQKEITINIDGGNTGDVKQAVAEALSTEFKTTELNMSSPTRF